MKRKALIIYLLTAFFGFLVLVGFPGSTTAIAQQIVHGNPSNYEYLLNQLGPGDTLLLEAGNYHQLYISNLRGEPGNSIVITGPESGPRAVILGDYGSNSVEIHNSSYLEIRNLEINCRNRGGDGVNAKTVTHNITLENLYIHSFSDYQQTVGISANHAPSWNWIIRNNIITDGGTGIYLGDSNGREQFIGGIIENNLIYDTIGYNMEIKHQAPRPDIPGIPTGKSVTIIRNNVFSKANNSSGESMARPNLLVGHVPTTGPGSDDEYHIYGNFFYQNPNEPLFQGEGNVAFYNNLLVNTLLSGYSEVLVQPHYDVPKMVRIFNNTIVTVNKGIHVSGGAPGYEQKVIANSVFSTGTRISAVDTLDNVVDIYASADSYLNNPFASPGAGLDLYPKPGMLTGTPVDSSSFKTFTAWNVDFNGDVRDGIFRGAYSGEGNNSRWFPQITKKPMVFDTTPPTIPQSLTAFSSSESQISLSWNSATDSETGIVFYKIYRNGSYVGQSVSTSYPDNGLHEDTAFLYEVSAVNAMGLESAKSDSVMVTTIADTTSPTVVSVKSTSDVSKVTVIFSEPVSQASASDILNYHINNGITIFSVTLESDSKTVTLHTSPHAEGSSYMLTVNNIHDRASLPNTISANSSRTYSVTYQLTISNLVVSSGEIYEVVSNGLTAGETVYIDRSYTYTNVPSSLENVTFIRTANDDKTSSSGSFITFDVNRDVTVYIAYDDKISVKPSWVTFIDTGVNLVASNTTLSLYSKNYAAGTIVLGGNESSEHSMYSVALKPTLNQDITPPASPSNLRIIMN